MRRTITSLTLLFAVLLAAPIGFARSPVASAERPRSFAIGLIGDFPYDVSGSHRPRTSSTRSTRADSRS